jgi:hypothetical protein
VTDDGLFIEGVGVEVIEGCTGGNQRVGYGLAVGFADEQFNAGRIDALLLGEVLPGVEGALGSRIRLLLRIRIAYHDEASVGLLIQGQSNVVEAALGFVIDSHGATKISCKAEAAEWLGLGYDGDGWGRNHDVGGCLGGLAEIVDHVAGYGDGAWTEAGGDELGGGA